MIEEVVCAVIVRKGRVLLTQRRPGKSFAYAWESPGGKAEMADSWHSALRRECLEELGITVGHLDEHPIAYHHDETRQVMFYAVTDWTGEPRPLEGQGIGWFTDAEMRRLTLTPGTEAASREIAVLLRVNEARKEPAAEAITRDALGWVNTRDLSFVGDKDAWEEALLIVRHSGRRPIPDYFVIGERPIVAALAKRITASREDRQRRIAAREAEMRVRDAEALTEQMASLRRYEASVAVRKEVREEELSRTRAANLRDLQQKHDAEITARTQGSAWEPDPIQGQDE